MIKLVYILILLAALSSFSSCDNSLPADQVSDIVFPSGDSIPSFSTHIRPFTQQKCSYAGCHSDFTMAGGRRITDYFSYFEAANIGFIVGDNPDASLFYQVMNGKNPHLVNYRIVAPNQNQISGVYKWIKAGVPNN